MRYALRQLALRPGFTAIAVLTLALGIGANTAIFSIVQGVLLAPLPYPQPGRLMVLHESTHDFTTGSVSYPNLEDWRRMQSSFTSLAGYRGDDFILSGVGHSQQPEHLKGETVSADFFKILGTPLLDGPGFSAAEDRTNGAPQVVLSYAFWQRRFGGNRQLVGETIPLNGQSALVVGILPRDFWFYDQADAFTMLGQWMPILLHNRGNHPGMRVVGRLRDGVTIEQARGNMSAIAAQLSTAYPGDDKGRGIDVRPMKLNIVGDAQSSILLLMGAVGLVLLIACANVANLLLARATGRRRELALRASLGATRGRILRQLLTESMVLGLAGGLAGLALAAVAVHAAPNLLPPNLPRLSQIAINGWVLGFTLAAALGCGLLFGLLPAWVSLRQDLHASLKDGGRSASGSSHRTQHVLVIAEVALALMLLAGAGLLIQSLVRLNRVAPGFDPNHAATMQFALAPGDLGNNERVASDLDTLLERVRAVPGITAASETAMVPISDNESDMGVWRTDKPQPAPDKVHSALSFFSTPGFAEALGIPLLRGRFLEPGDVRGRPLAMVIDTEMAKIEFPGEDPIGKQISTGFMGPFQVVGIVGHVKHFGLGADASAKIQEQMYTAIDQIPMQYMSAGGQGLSLVVRAAGDPMTLVPAIRAAVAGAGNDQPIYGVTRMTAVVAASLAAQRVMMWLLASFAILAVLLAAIGVYGVLAYAVAQRTQEVGIRMALGAEPNRVLGMMLRQGLGLAAVGAVIGIAGALLTTRFLKSNLYGVAATDPATLAGVTLLLLGLAALASYLPARRAARVNPIAALRAE
ncbi:MAG TPA: ABC transporter permease [Terriglobales bacterium]|nr:ABC transporter permease [Terriglobales bacterium]